MSNLEVACSTRLMEEHRMGTSVTASTEFLASRGPAGELDLFYIGKRADGSLAVHNLQREATSETGWRHLDLSNRFVPGGVASGLDPADSDSQIVFAFDDNPYGVSIYWAKESESGTWGEWQLLDPNTIRAPDLRVKAIRAECIDGALQLFAVLGHRPGKPFRPDEVWTIPWKTQVEGCRCLGQVSSEFMKYVNVKGIGEGLLVTDLPESGDGEDLILVKAGEPPVRERIASSVPTSLLSVEERRSGYSVIFSRADPVLVQGAPVLFIDCGLDERNPRVIPTTEKLVPRQLLAVDAEALPLTLYLVNEDNCLYVTKQVGTQADGELSWMPPLPLGYRFRYVAGGINRDGYAQIFGLGAQPGAEDRLECIFKSPPIEGENMEEMAPSWQWCTIDLPVETMESLSVYAADLTISDGSGQPWSAKPVWIAANEMVDVEVSYRHCYLGPKNWTRVTTDAAGCVTLVSRTRSLNGPKWLLREDPPSARAVVADEVDVSIDAAEHTMARLKNMTEKDVRAVLPPETQGDAPTVHEAIGRLMEYHAAGMPAAGPVSLLTPLDPTRLPDGAWQLTIDDAGVRLREIGSDEFDRYVSALRAEPDAFFHDLIQWFTDAAESIANGIEARLEYSFNKVAEGVRVAIKLVTDTFTWAFDGVIRFAEQVMQISETIFNHAKAFFEDLFAKFFGLILEPYLQDVRAAADFMQDHFLEVLNELIKTVDGAKPHVADFFQRQHVELEQGFDRLLETLGDKTFDYRRLQPAALAAPVANMDGGKIVGEVRGMTAFSGYFVRKAQSPSAQMQGGFDPGAELRDGISKFLKTLDQGISDELSREAETLRTFLETSFDSPERFMHATLRLALQTVRNCLSLALDCGEAVAEGFLNLVSLVLKSFRKIFFDSPIENSILQALYKLAYPDARPEELTLGRLFFLLCGAPVAICWRVLFLKPFGRIETGRELSLYGAGAMPGANENLLVRSRLTLVQQIQIAAVCAGILKLFPGSFCEVLFDVCDTMPGWLTVAGGALLPLLIVVLGTPSDLFTIPWPAVAYFDNGAWALGAVAPTLALLLCCLPGSEGLKKAEKVFVSIMGVLCMCGNVAKMIAHMISREFSDASLYAGCIEPISSVAKPLTFAGPKGVAAVVVIDCVCAWGGGAADILTGVLAREEIAVHA